MEIKQYSFYETKLCNSSSALINVVKIALQGIELANDHSLTISQRIRNALLPKLVSQGLTGRFPIDPSVTHDDYASFFIDFYLNESQIKCDHMHRYLLQFMFDNRQAIGTNLLKFQIANDNAIQNGRVATSIAICVEKESLRKLGWDGAAAGAQEYVHALSGPYKSMFKFPMTILSIANL